MLEEKELKYLQSIYEHLLRVETNVINGYIMIDGMRALQNFIIEQKNKIQEKGDKEET